MPRSFPLCVLLGGLLAVVCVPARGDEAESDGWPRVTAVPSWVLEPLPREGWVRVAQISRSNLRELIFPPHDRERQARATLAARLRPVLGAEAERAAAAVPVQPPVRQASWHHSPARGGWSVPGRAYWVKFVLFEYPLASVLSAVPEAERAALRKHLTAPPYPEDVDWTPVAAPPAWADLVHLERAALRVATSEIASRHDVAEVFSLLAANVRGPIQRRLKPVVGNEIAHAAAVNAAARRRLLARAMHTGTTKRLLGRPTSEVTLWQLWEIPLEEILVHVPEGWRDAARVALAGPEPEAASRWQTVHEEPAWVREPPQWPGHVPIVQIRRAEQSWVAQQRASKLGEQDVAKALVLTFRRLGAVPRNEEQSAAAAGARKRRVARLVVQLADAEQRAAGPRFVTTYSLWQVPLEAILDALPAAEHARARAVLSPQR